MEYILELKNITKLYPGVTALDHVSMSYEPGLVHAIMGENGAGKSTLIKIIAGAIDANEGIVVVDGIAFDEMTPKMAKDNGIGVIYQEFNIIPSLSAAENIFLGEKLNDSRMVVNIAEMERRTAELFKELEVEIDPSDMVGDLSTAQQQVVEIAKAVSKDVKVLIMDEPTASLAASEVENLFKIVERLKKRGVTILYISHRMDEIYRISDTVTVMRDGCYVDKKKTGEMTRKQLISLMVGREVSEKYPERDSDIQDTILKVKHVTGNGDRDISFELKKGEVLGVAGLVGAGRTELAKVLYGAAKMDSGTIEIAGKEVGIHSVDSAVAAGIGLIPEDRKGEGCLLSMPINWNISLMTLKENSHMMVLNETKLEAVSKHYFERLSIKAPSMEQLVSNLSGGNQQKVCLARTLAAQPEIIIFDEPTRGIDVGAKQEIYKIINELVNEGISIIMISSEMEELIGMSDRIIVLHEGEKTGELDKEEFSQDRIMELASGIKE